MIAADFTLERLCQGSFIPTQGPSFETPATQTRATFPLEGTIHDHIPRSARRARLEGRNEGVLTPPVLQSRSRPRAPKSVGRQAAIGVASWTVRTTAVS